MDNEDTSTNEDFDLLGDLLDGKDIDAVEESEADEPSGDNKSVEETGDQTEAQGDDIEGEGEKQPEESTDGGESPEVTPPAEVGTKDQLKEALRELASEQQSFTQTRQTLREQFKQELYPQGVEAALEPLVDSEGTPIKGVSDVAGRLINPDTQEVFTYEEAKDWLARATADRNRRMDEIEQNIDAYAETHQTLNEGEKVVMGRYGELLKSMPDVAKEAFEGYQATLVKDKSGLVVKAPVDVVRFYDTIMRPYISVAKQMQLEAEGKAEEGRKQAEKNSQADRADLELNNSAAAEKEKDALDKAFDEYFG